MTGRKLEIFLKAFLLLIKASLKKQECEENERLLKKPSKVKKIAPLFLIIKKHNILYLFQEGYVRTYREKLLKALIKQKTNIMKYIIVIA